MEQNKTLLYSINLLNRRWYTVKSLREKLIEKKYPQDEISLAIDFLTDKKMLDDTRFAYSFIKDRLNFNPKSKYLINRELFKKGVDKQDSEIAWQQIEEELQPDELSIVTDLARRKLRSYQSLPEEVQNRRLISYLARKGYSYDLIQKSLAILLEQE